MTKQYSKPFHEPGVRYAISVSIVTGSIVWIYGPFELWFCRVIKSFITVISKCQLDGERVADDYGYVNNHCVQCQLYKCEV